MSTLSFGICSAGFADMNSQPVEFSVFSAARLRQTAVFSLIKAWRKMHFCTPFIWTNRNKFLSRVAELMTSGEIDQKATLLRLSYHVFCYLVYLSRYKHLTTMFVQQRKVGTSLPPHAPLSRKGGIKSSKGYESSQQMKYNTDWLPNVDWTLFSQFPLNSSNGLFEDQGCVNTPRPHRATLASERSVYETLGGGRG